MSLRNRYCDFLSHLRCHQSGRFPRSLREDVVKRVSGHDSMATSGNENPGDPEESRSFAGGGIESRHSNTGHLSRILHKEKSKNENE